MKAAADSVAADPAKFCADGGISGLKTSKTNVQDMCKKAIDVTTTSSKAVSDFTTCRKTFQKCKKDQIEVGKAGGNCYVNGNSGMPTTPSANGTTPSANGTTPATGTTNSGSGTTITGATTAAGA